MRNNNTFGIKYPTGSIGRYKTEDINEMTNTSAGNLDNVHRTKVIKNKTKNIKD
jgi:D-mannonate dehydratase